MNQQIIDAHSHIGIDNTWKKKGTLLEYISNAKLLGITESLLMPVPMPIIGIGQYSVTPIMVGTYMKEQFVIQGIQDKNGTRAIPVSQNPYHF